MIKYKKGNISKLDDILLRPPKSKISNLGTLMHMDPFSYDAYRETYSKDEDLKEELN